MFNIFGVIILLKVSLILFLIIYFIRKKRNKLKA
jgi:hypothetical protein